MDWFLTLLQLSVLVSTVTQVALLYPWISDFATNFCCLVDLNKQQSLHSEKKFNVETRLVITQGAAAVTIFIQS